jgi:2'-5' RNA ligase
MSGSAEIHPRLFLALWPDDAARQCLAAWRDQWSWPAGASPTRTERLHMTLHFIGPVPADCIGPLCAALPSQVPEMVLEFGRAELWRGGIATACPLQTPDALLHLHAQLGDVLRAQALPVEERAFRAHVTLARRAQGAGVPTGGPPFEWVVGNGLALVESLPGGQGYRVLGRFG